MNDKDTQRIIEQTIRATVAELKTAGLMNQNTRSAKERTEELLRQYPLFKQIKGRKQTERVVAAVDEALRSFSADPYSEIIRRHYFERQGLESIALDLNISTKTARKHKKRLVAGLAAILFSDETIQEIFFK